jgi:hypothetical protein
VKRGEARRAVFILNSSQRPHHCPLPGHRDSPDRPAVLRLKQGIAPPDQFGLINPRGDQGLSDSPGFVAQQLLRTVYIRKKPEGGMKLSAENPVGVFQVLAPVVKILIH